MVKKVNTFFKVLGIIILLPIVAILYQLIILLLPVLLIVGAIWLLIQDTED